MSDFEKMMVKEPFNIQQMKPIEDYGKLNMSGLDRKIGELLKNEGFTHFR